MPVYNNEKTLKHAIDAILNQTIYDLELILINDGSTDASAQICEEYAKKEPLLVEVIHQEKKGAAQARNAGLMKSSGKYIYFANATDIVNNKMLEDNYKLAQEKEADLIVFGFTEYNDSYLDGQLEHLPSLPEMSSQAIFRQHYRNFHHFFPYILHNKLYRREHLKNNRIRFRPVPDKTEAFFNLNVYKNLKKVAFNRLSYCEHYGVDQAVKQATYNNDLYEINLKLARNFEAMMNEWNYETEFQDLIVNEYYQVVYDELENISSKTSGLSTEEQEEKIQTILSDERVNTFLKTLNPAKERNPFMKAVIIALQKENGKAAIQFVNHKNGTEKARSKFSRFLRKLFKRQTN
jgi:glycosyltransferase involved in cell wall biosynthesis